MVRDSSLIEKLWEKDKRFVAFCEGLKDENAKQLNAEEFFAKVKEIQDNIEEINLKIKKTSDENEKGKLREERKKWQKERNDYYKEINKIKKSLSKNVIYDESKGFFFNQEDRFSYARLLQLVTLYDKLKTNFDFSKDIVSQVEKLHSVQDQLNKIYKEIFKTDELLEEKEAIPRRKVETESLEEYQSVVQSFYQEKENQDFLDDYWYFHFQDLQENSEILSLVVSLLPENLWNSFLSFCGSMTPNREQELWVSSLLVDFDSFSPDYKAYIQNSLVESAEVLQKEEHIEQNVLRDIRLLSTLMEYIYTYEIALQKNSNKEELETFKKNINNQFYLVSGKKIDLFSFKDSSVLNHDVEEVKEPQEDIIEHPFVSNPMETEPVDGVLSPLTEDAYQELVREQTSDMIPEVQDGVGELEIPKVEENSSKEENSEYKWVYHAKLPIFQKKLVEILDNIEKKRNPLHSKVISGKILNSRERELLQKLDADYYSVHNELERVQSYPVVTDDIIEPFTNIPDPDMSLDDIIEHIQYGIPYAEKIVKRDETMIGKAFRVVRKATKDILSKPKNVVLASAIATISVVTVLTSFFGGNGNQDSKILDSFSDGLAYEKMSDDGVVDFTDEKVISDAFLENNSHEKLIWEPQEEVLEETKEEDVPTFGFGDAFQITMNTKVYQSEYLGRDGLPSYSPYFSPDIIREPLEFDFYNTITGTVDRAYNEEELSSYRDSDCHEFIGVGSSDGFYDIRDITVIKNEIEKGMGR